MKKSLTCIECPRGCTVTVDTETKETTGNLCPKGGAYALAELIEPMRILTSTVRVEGGMLSVKTDKPVRKSELFEVMKKINAVRVFTDVAIGDIIAEDIDGRGANLVATKSYTPNKK